MVTSPKKNKRILDKELVRAFTDLNRIFPQEEIAKKFKIKKWRISAYKKPKKRKPFDKRKRKEIIKFYKAILTQKPLYYQYDYRVVKGRVKPIVDYTMAKTKDVKTRIEIKKLAKIMGVKPETIRRWQQGRIVRMRHKTREKLWKVHKKYLKKLDGLFFVCKRTFKKLAKKEFKLYCYIFYYKNSYGTKEEFYEAIRIAVVELRDSLIAERGKFKEEDVISFLANLKDVSKAYKRSSIEMWREFLKRNFKGVSLTRLLAMLKRYDKK